jgi:membrane protein DedA with SNARE-associated domain
VPVVHMVSALLVSSHQIDGLLAGWGYVVVFAFVAIESLGVPFPGETALIAAAVYAGSTHHLGIAYVIAAGAAGAIVGDNAGFALGRWGGVRLLRRYGPYVRLTESRAKLGRYLFMRHGGKLVFFGRFLTGLRTWAAFLAGTNRMSWRRFLAFNAAGGIAWALLYGLGYFYLGGALERASSATDIALTILLVLLIAGWVFYLRRHESRLTLRAERALGSALEQRGDGVGP